MKRGKRRKTKRRPTSPPKKKRDKKCKSTNNDSKRKNNSIDSYFFVFASTSFDMEDMQVGMRIMHYKTKPPLLCEAIDMRCDVSSAKL